MNNIKLKPKQLAALRNIQSQKAQLQKLFQEFNEKESLVLELIFEENGVIGTPTDVKLLEDSIDYEIKDEVKKKIKTIKE